MTYDEMMADVRSMVVELHSAANRLDGHRARMVEQLTASRLVADTFETVKRVRQAQRDVDEGAIRSRECELAQARTEIDSLRRVCESHEQDARKLNAELSRAENEITGVRRALGLADGEGNPLEEEVRSRIAVAEVRSKLAEHERAIRAHESAADQLRQTNARLEREGGDERSRRERLEREIADLRSQYGACCDHREELKKRIVELENTIASLREYEPEHIRLRDDNQGLRATVESLRSSRAEWVTELKAEVTRLTKALEAEKEKAPSPVDEMMRAAVRAEERERCARALEEWHMGALAICDEAARYLRTLR